MKPPPPVREAARAWQAAWAAQDPAAERLAARLDSLGWVISATGAGHSLEPKPLAPACRLGFAAVREMAGQSLSCHTTLRLGGPARRFAVAESEADVVDAVRAADAVGEPVLVLGGGSNLVVSDEGFAGSVVQVATRGVERAADRVTVAAGEVWDQVVEQLVAEGRQGVEALAGIPGLVGATPIQNVGAYGQDVAQTIVSVRVLDRRSGAVADLSAPECRFSYRHSRFKGSHDHVVLAVTFRLQAGTTGAPVGYAALARHLGVEVGTPVP
ncbi:MAG: UDP-N-acetylmuramate dehydrogenase, partial [Actinomycetes bacterium]